MITWADAKQRLQDDVLELGEQVAVFLLAEVVDEHEGPDGVEWLVSNRAEHAWRPA